MNDRHHSGAPRKTTVGQGATSPVQRNQKNLQHGKVSDYMQMEFITDHQLEVEQTTSTSPPVWPAVCGGRTRNCIAG